MAVAAADDHRRRREASRHIWRIAPAVTAVCLIAAALGRWVSWPAAVPFGVMALGIGGLGIYAYLQRRRHPISDAVASAIDADGAFGGELRSASWFAGRDERDEWAQYHLDRAAARLTGADWVQQYPPLRTGRARLASLGMLVAAVVIAIAVPARTGVRASGFFAAPSATDAVPGKAPSMMQAIPEDLRKQLEDLLAAAERGTMSKEKQAAKAAELWNLFTEMNADLDEEALKALAKAMDPTQQGSRDEAAKKMTELAGRALKAANAKGVPPDLKKALEDLGMQLSESAEAEARSGGDQAQAGAPGADSTPGSSAASQAAPSLDQASIQFAKDNDPGAGAGMMMMSDQAGAMGDPSAGFGGGGHSGAPKGGGKLPGFEQALRRETVEASSDTNGANVLSEVRRKTERGQATVDFTHSAAGVGDRSRASAPPPVPEGRRASVQTYFTRKQ